MDTFTAHTIIDENLAFIDSSDSLTALLRGLMQFEGADETENSLPYVIRTSFGAYVGTLALESQDAQHSGVYRWCPIVGDVQRFAVAYVLDDNGCYVETTINVI